MAEFNQDLRLRRYISSQAMPHGSDGFRWESTPGLFGYLAKRLVFGQG